MHTDGKRLHVQRGLPALAMYNVCKNGWRGHYGATASVTRRPLTDHLSPPLQLWLFVCFSHTDGHDLCVSGRRGRGFRAQRSEGSKCSEAPRLCTGGKREGGERGETAQAAALEMISFLAVFFLNKFRK